MLLKDHLRSLPDEDAREAFAVRCGTSIGHMRNTIYDKKKALAPASCVAVERESCGAVRRWDMRPDDWHLIWPELVGADGAPAVPAAEAAHG